MEKLLNNQENFNQPKKPEKEEDFFNELTDLVGDLYRDRLSKKNDITHLDLMLKDNLDHVTQVKDNVDFIIEEIKSGRMSDDIIPKENGQVVFDEKLLKTMAILHDAAKIDEEGKLDTYYHHDKEKVSKVLCGEASPIHQFLAKNNFSREQIDLMIDGIEKHSRRTEFIAKYFFEKNVIKPEGEQKNKILPTMKDPADWEIYNLPSPEGVLEYVILSDADILTQSRLEQGVKKIVCYRLTNEAYRQEDTEDAKTGKHSFAKTLASALESAKNVNNAMHFSTTKDKAAGQYKQVEDFKTWLEDNNKIAEIDAIKDFGDKKKEFDGLIAEFLKQAK